MAFLIVVDGAAGVGKGTLAKGLAKHYGFSHLDSGLLYRAVTYRVLKQGVDPIQAARTLEVEELNNPELRSEEISNATPAFAKISEVRDEVNISLRRLIAESEGSVIDGRAGAFEFPEAQVKFYLTTSDEVRASRRCMQLERLGMKVSYEDVLTDIRERDRKDRDRAVAPMRPAHDAVVIDNTILGIKETLAQALAVCELRLHPDAR